MQVRQERTTSDERAPLKIQNPKPGKARMIILVDIEKLLSSRDMELMDSSIAA